MIVHPLQSISGPTCYSVAHMPPNVTEYHVKSAILILSLSGSLLRAYQLFQVTQYSLVLANSQSVFLNTTHFGRNKR